MTKCVLFYIIKADVTRRKDVEKLVSIVLPCYNVAKYLDKNINSLLNQTYKNLQLIFVNDGSKDDTLTILNKYASLDERIIVVDKPNGGVSTARNAGLERAEGEYITFCDPDDYVSPIYIQTQVETLEKYDADVCVCKYKRVKEDSDLKFRKTSLENIKEFNTEQAVAQLMSGVLFDVCCWNKIFKAEFVKNLRFNEDIYYAEDVHFCYFAFKNIKKLVYNPTILYAYVMRKGSLVKSKFNERKLSGLEGIRQICVDCDVAFPNVTKVAHAWYCMVHLEMLYYTYRDKWENYERIFEMLDTMEANIPYLKQSKIIQKYRRTLVPVAHSLLKNIFIKRREEYNKNNELKVG